MKMKERNTQLKNALGAMASKETVKAVAAIPKENAKNRQGCAAYSLSDGLRLISMYSYRRSNPKRWYRFLKFCKKDGRIKVYRKNNKMVYEVPTYFEE